MFEQRDPRTEWWCRRVHSRLEAADGSPAGELRAVGVDVRTHRVIWLAAWDGQRRLLLLPDAEVLPGEGKPVRVDLDPARVAGTPRIGIDLLLAHSLEHAAREHWGLPQGPTRYDVEPTALFVRSVLELEELVNPPMTAAEAAAEAVERAAREDRTAAPAKVTDAGDLSKLFGS